MGIAAATSSPGWRYRYGSASSGACSRPCRRRRSSAVTARPSPPRGQCAPRPVASNFSREPLAEADTSGTRFRPCPKERMGGVGRRVYDRSVLRRLRIENLVLIRQAELELAPGLNAITGETGAGKTILAQALGLLLGAKGDDSYVGAAGEEAYVEAELDLPDDLEALADLRALVEDTDGMEPGEEEGLRAERERHRHVAELAAGAAAAASALAPDEGEGATGLVALAERAVAPLERLAPELQRAGDELRDVELRLRETASDLHAFLASLEADPGRLEQLEGELDRIAEAKRRFRCATYEELLARREGAQAELAALEDGSDPAEVAGRELTEAETRAP